MLHRPSFEKLAEERHAELHVHAGFDHQQREPALEDYPMFIKTRH